MLLIFNNLLFLLLATASVVMLMSQAAVVCSNVRVPMMLQKQNCELLFTDEQNMARMAKLCSVKLETFRVDFLGLGVG